MWKVYAGIDPLSGKRHYLTETVPAGPRALAEAKKVRTRLIGQVDEQRSPCTRATVDQLMDRYLDVLDVEVTTRARYDAAIRLHVRPLLGSLPVAKLTGETIDAFQAVLRRCREHCDGRPFVVHGGKLRPGEGKQSGEVDHAAWGGIYGLAVRASRMASMGRRPWLRALTR